MCQHKEVFQGGSPGGFGYKEATEKFRRDHEPVLGNTREQLNHYKFSLRGDVDDGEDGKQIC